MALSDRPNAPSGTRPYLDLPAGDEPGEREAEPEPDRQERAQQTVRIVFQLQHVLAVDEQRRLEKRCHEPKIDAAGDRQAEHAVRSHQLEIAA